MAKEPLQPARQPALDPEMVQPVNSSKPLSRSPLVQRRGRLNHQSRPSAHERPVNAPRIESWFHRLISFKLRSILRRARVGFKSARAFEKHSYLVVHAAPRPSRVRATHCTTTDCSSEERRAQGGPPPCWPERLAQTRNPTLSLTRAGLIWVEGTPASAKLSGNPRTHTHARDVHYSVNEQPYRAHSL